MAVLLRLAVIVLLVVHFVQSAPETKRDKSHQDKNRPKQVQSQQTVKRIGSIDLKKQISRNEVQNTAPQRKSLEVKLKRKTGSLQTEIKKENQLKSSKKGDISKAVISKSKAPQNVKIASKDKKTKKTIPKKKPMVVKEFPLNDIIFKGRATNEANAFIRANDKVGKALELIYEHAREQDLNELEEQIKRRMIAYRR